MLANTTSYEVTLAVYAKLLVRAVLVGQTVSRMKQHKDVVSSLIDHQLEHLLTKVFLYLDPGSLHQAKLVCVSWCVFIQDSIWDRKSIRRKLQSRHLERWKNAEQEAKSWVVRCREEERVVSLSCDEWVLIAGLDSGLAKVYSIESCGFVNLLNCRDDYYDLGPSDEEILVYSDIGDYLIVTTTSKGVVIAQHGNIVQLYSATCHSQPTT